MSKVKRFLSLSLLVALLFTLGCTAKDASGTKTPDATTSPTATVEATPEASAKPDATAKAEETVAENMSARNITMEYGDPESLVVHNDELSAYVIFPQTGVDAIDEVISAWAKDTVDAVRREVAELQKSNPEAECELNVQYHAYLALNGYAGIVEIGDCMSSENAHPVDVIKTFNIDIQSETILDNTAMFKAEKKQDILDMLWEKLSAMYPDATVEAAKDSWLDNPVLTTEGVTFVIPRGELPTYLGTQEVAFTYEELENILTLEAAEHTPAPEATGKEDIPIGPVYSAELDGTGNAPRTISPDRPMVALTFDDGPSKTTPKILNLLEQYGGRATFCVVGNRVSSYSNTVAQVIAQGSEVISHTWSHKKLTALSKSGIRSELQKAQDAIVAAGAPAPNWLRPPYGSVNDSVKEVAAEFGYALVNWSIDTEDWKTRNADTTYRRIMAEVEDGSIILCHDLHAETGDAMELVIPALVEQGYQLVTVSELMAAKGVSVNAGSLYRHP